MATYRVNNTLSSSISKSDAEVLPRAASTYMQNIETPQNVGSGPERSCVKCATFSCTPQDSTELWQGNRQ